MSYKKYNSNKKYENHLSPGTLPDGISVKYQGDFAHVVTGSSPKSKIKASAPAGSGAIYEVLWVENSELMIEEN